MKYLLVLLILVSLNAFPADDYVESLPGYNYSKSKMYSGLLNVDTKRRLHYLFVESQRNPATDPVLLWMNGGPGCSSLLGFTDEHGPLVFEEGTTNLVINEYSWNKQANVIYLEAPAGVGFSEGSFLLYDDVKTSTDNLNALKLWFEKFPEYAKNDFFISGESYAGVYVPTLASKVVEYNSNTQKKINLKGILVGNGVTDSNFDNNYALLDFAWDHGIYGEELKADIDKDCGTERPAKSNSKCNAHIDVVNRIFQKDNINIYDIYRTCYGVKSESNSSLGKYYYTPFLYNDSNAQLQADPPCASSVGARDLFNRIEVKKALHVNQNIEWDMCNNLINIKYTRGDSIAVYPKLLSNNIRILIYSGDTDGAVPINGTKLWLNNMNLPLIKEYHPWSVTENEISGYVQVYKGLNFVTIKDTGHMVPQWKRKEASYMLNQFLANRDI